MDGDVKEIKQHKRWTLVNKNGEVEGSDSESSSSLEVLDEAAFQACDVGVCQDDADPEHLDVEGCKDDAEPEHLDGAVCIDDADPAHPDISACLDDASQEHPDVGACLEEAELEHLDVGLDLHVDDVLPVVTDEQPSSQASTPEDNDAFQQDSTDSTEKVTASYQRQSSSDDFEKLPDDDEGKEESDAVKNKQVAPSVEEGGHQEVDDGPVEPPAEKTEDHVEAAGSDEDFVQVPEPEPAKTVHVEPSTGPGVSNHLPHPTPFLHLQRKKRHSGSTDSSDSDFVRLEPSMAEDVPPASQMTVSSSSNSSSVSQGFFFFRRGYRREDEDDLLPGDVDDRCESDISGVAADDSDDMSSVSDCLGDIPLTAENVPRSYRHKPNSSLSATLTKLSLLVLFTGIGIGIGHFIGTSWDIPDNQMEIDILNNRLEACDKSAELLDYQLKETQRDLEALVLERQRYILETGEADAMKDKQIQLLLEESQELRKDKEKLIQELVNLRSSLEDLEQKNLALNTDRDDIHEQWEEELEKNRALQEEIRSVGQVLEQQQEQTIILQNILNELNKEIAELRNNTRETKTSQTSPHDEQIKQLNEEVDKLQEERDELQQQLRQAQQTHHAELKDVNKKQGEALALSKTLQEKVDLLSTENMELRDEVMEKDAAVKLLRSLQEKLNLLAVENTELREEVGRTRYATNSAEKSAEDLAFMKRQMTTLQHKYERLRASRAALQKVQHDETEVCEDTNAGCEKWAILGECKKNPSYMNKYCQKSCRVCQGSADLSSQPQEEDKTDEKMNTLKDKVASLQQENSHLQADIEALKQSVLKSEKEKQATDTDIQGLKTLLEAMEQQLTNERHRAGMFEKLYITLQNQQSKAPNQTFNTSLFNCIHALVSSVKVNMSEIIRTANFTVLNDANRYIKDYQGVLENITKDTEFVKYMDNVWNLLKSKVGSDNLKEYFDKVQTSYEDLQNTVKEKWDAYSSNWKSDKNTEDQQGQKSKDGPSGDTSLPELIGTTLHKTLDKVQEFSHQVVHDHQEALRSIRDSLKQLKDHIHEKWTKEPEEESDPIDLMKTSVPKQAEEPVKVNGFGKERREQHRHHRHHKHKHHHHRHHHRANRYYHGNQHQQSHHGNQHHPESPPPSPRDLGKLYHTYTEEYDPHLQKWVYSYRGAPYDHIDAENWQIYTDLQEESPFHEQKVDRVHRDTQSEPTTVHEEPEFQGFNPNELLHDSFFEGNDRKWNKYKKNFKKMLGRLQKFNEESLVTLDEDDLEDMYEDLDDFIDDLDDVEVSDKLKTWLACQERWWKGRLHRKHRDQDLVKGCGSHLMRWQLTVICKESCNKGGCNPSCPSIRQNSQAMCSGDKKLCRSDNTHGANKDRSEDYHMHRDTSSHYSFNATSPDHAMWYFRRAQDRDNHLADGKWYFRRTGNGRYYYRYIRSRPHHKDDSAWYFNRAHEREYHHHKTDWVFNRAAEREFHRKTPDDWYFRRFGDHQHRRR